MQLSIIIPVYNAEAFLRECLDSVFAQRGVDLEAIAVDDASTDGSLALLREYARRERRLTVIVHSANRGAGVCRNIGMSAAHGDWLHFLDADDKVVPGAYRTFLDVAEEEKADMIRGNGLSSDAAYLHLNVSRRLKRHPVSLASEGAELLKLSVVPWLGIVRRQLVVEKGLSFSALKCANDVSFFMAALLAARKIRFLPQPLVWHRVGISDSLTSRRNLHYRCDFENYRIVDAATADGPADLRALLLSGVLFGICGWLKRYRRLAVENWPEIRAFATAFFRDLDPSPWKGGARSTRWYYEAYRILGAAAFPEKPAFPARIILGRTMNLARRLLARAESLVCRDRRVAFNLKKAVESNFGHTSVFTR